MTAYEPNVVLSTQEYGVVGTRPIRHDGIDKVTGRAQYGADIQMPRLLHGKVLRSPHAHARIKSIDISKAERHPGIQAVVTAGDFPARGSDDTLVSGEAAVRLQYLRDNILASDKVLYKGQPVAAVAAASPHVAEEALDLIEVEYEVLLPVLTAPDGMKDDAPLLHNSLKTDDVGNRTDKVSNVASHFQHRLGNIEKGFQDADLVIEREFNTKTVHQGYIEPHNATAYWSMDGRVTIWCSTQGPF